MSGGVCACGCGGKTTLAKVTNAAKGLVNGRHVRCLKGHNVSHHNLAGPSHPNWKGGRTGAGNGYIQVYSPDHPRANQRGYVPEHILVASNALGRAVPATAEVHHINENKSDNRPENLVVCQDKAYHALLHQRARALRSCGHANWVKCWICKRWGPKETLRFPRAGQKGAPYHPSCIAKKQGEYRRAKRS